MSIARLGRLMLGFFTILVALEGCSKPQPQSQTAAASWWDRNWAYRQELTIDNSSIGESLIDFPVLVHLTAAVFDFSKAQAAGQDIRFVDSSNQTLLSYEIEEWDRPNQEAHVWVKVPQVDASSMSDYVYLYYGNPAAGDGQDAIVTWNNDYVAVFHMNDGSDSAHVKDSTGKQADGTKSSFTAPAAGTAMIGNGQVFAGNSYVDCFAGASLSFGAGSFTIEAFMNVPTGITTRAILAKGNDYYSQGYSIWVSNGGNTVATVEGDGESSFESIDYGDLRGGWHSVAVVKTARLNATLDGVQLNPGPELANLGNLDSTGHLYLGGNPKDTSLNGVSGVLDEIRLSRVARSPDWLKATFLSESDNYVHFSTEAAVSALSVNTGTARFPDGGVKVVASLASTGSDKTVSVYFRYGTSRDRLDRITPRQERSLPGAFSQPLDNLVPDSTYYFQAFADGSVVAYGEVVSFRTPVIVADLYLGFVNQDGTMKFVDRTSGATILDRSATPSFDYGKTLVFSRDLKPAVSVEGDAVTVVSTDDSNPYVTVAHRYELHRHSPNVKYLVTISYKQDVTVSSERFDFIIPSRSAVVMTRDLQLTRFHVLRQYYSDFFTPRVARFDNGLSFSGEDSMQSMSFRSYSPTSSVVSFYADYMFNHPYSRYVKQGGGVTVDRSAQRRASGDISSSYVTFSVGPAVAPVALVKARQPFGFDATMVFTDHADGAMLAPLKAVAYGTTDEHDPAFGVKGVVSRGFGWTQSIFLSGAGGSDLGDPVYEALIDRMYRDGVEIIGHSISPGTDDRETVTSGLQTLSQYGARNWIDHGAGEGERNWEALASQGALEGDANYILDLLDSFNYEFAWSYIDLPLRSFSPNMLAPADTGAINPFFYYNGNLDDNTRDNRRLYLWSTIDTNEVSDRVYTAANIDMLIAQRGLSIGHDYKALDTSEGHLWYVNPATGNTEITPVFDGELGYMQAQREAGLLWTPTMATLGVFLKQWSNVNITDNHDGTYRVTNNDGKVLRGLTLLGEFDIASATIDGQRVTFGGKSGSKEIVIPSLEPGRSVTLAVSFAEK